MRHALLGIITIAVAAGSAGTAAAATKTACVGSASQLSDALAALSTATDNSDADEIRVRVGTYVAPAGGFAGAVTNHHNLTIAGGYLDEACTRRTLDASATVLDGDNAGGVLTINTTAIPNSDIEVSGLTFQNGNGFVAFQSSAGALKIGDPGPISGGAILVERNIFRHNSASTGLEGTHATGGLLAATDGSPLIVRDNLFLDNSSPDAAALYVYSNNAIDVSNNTFTMNESADTSVAPREILDYFTIDKLMLSNNIFWGNVLGENAFDINFSGQGRQANIIDNDIQSFNGVPTQAAGTSQADPLFAGAGDFRLSAASPLIDAGTDDPSGGLAAADLDGAPRHDGTAVDLGAYESSYVFGDGFE